MSTPSSRINTAPTLPVSAAPFLSAVVVNYATWQATARLSRHLLRTVSARKGAAEVVIVDNHSPPHRLLARLRRWPGVSLRRWRHNRGFGRAVNEGVRLSRGDWLLLLNPDVTVPDGFVDQVLQHAEQAPPTVGIIGFRLLNTDGTPQPSAGRFPTFAQMLLGLFRPRAQRKYLNPQPQQRCDVDWLSGCCLLLRRECFTQVGGFDPDFFLYYEDVDLCQRARSLGWSVVFEPALSVQHHRPLHSRTVPPHIRLFTRHALLTYAAKHWPAWQTSLLAALIRGEAWLRGLMAWWRGQRLTARIFRELRGIAADLGRGQRQQVWTRLTRIARQEERRRAARAIHRHPQPQPAGPAAGVSEERHSIRATEHADHRD